MEPWHPALPQLRDCVQDLFTGWFSLLLVVHGLAVAVGDGHVKGLVLLRELYIPLVI